eukprot:CAMPEP_0176439158 /NCGR_PEP_ID=MMETSP0127-20121128/19767_1 /TAXON_ID=938130 /ORGANISM="Platyophrya macrostoma, Strain WH" /LENGTH=252 /DNA_ID=CAMNT_0017823355 /DNA_START=24 /DNA_END=782 /DNA_ORIENTATION=-
MSDDNYGFSIDQSHQDSELEDLQRQVQDLQEDLQVRQAVDAAAREEGQRKAVAAPVVPATKNTSIFVGGTDPAKTTENDLRLFFANCGPIRRVTILKDRFTMQPRGACYVEFETEEGMNMAVSTKDGQTLHGRPLKVAVKRELPPGAPRGGMGMPPGMGGYRGGMGMAPGMMMGPMGGGMPPMGGYRGGRGGGQPGMMMGGMNPAMGTPQQQQMMAAQMMAMMSGGMGFSPYGAPRGRGGRGGPGRGAGRPY